MDDRFVEVDLLVLKETELAFLLSDGDNEWWVPKSCIRNSDELEVENNHTVEIAYWKAMLDEII